MNHKKDDLHPVKSIPKRSLHYLALGDSYTIGESVKKEDSWPIQLNQQIWEKFCFRFDSITVIAKTGWRTDDLMDKIRSSSLNTTHDFVSLLIGVNDQYQGVPISQYPNSFEELLKKSIQLAGNQKRVLVLSIPDYGNTPFGNSSKDKISREIDEYNAINQSISEKWGVTYIDITDISRKPKTDLIAEDNLHPSSIQYSEWVRKILNSTDFKEILKNTIFFRPE